MTKARLQRNTKVIWIKSHNFVYNNGMQSNSAKLER